MPGLIALSPATIVRAIGSVWHFLSAGWQVQFCEADVKTPLPRTFTFTDPEKIRELAKRGDAWGLGLTPEQCRKLRRLTPMRATGKNC
jgi:hypothetical protein